MTNFAGLWMKEKLDLFCRYIKRKYCFSFSYSKAQNFASSFHKGNISFPIIGKQRNGAIKGYFSGKIIELNVNKAIYIYFLNMKMSSFIIVI